MFGIIARSIIVILLLAGIITALLTLVPDPLTSSVRNSAIYFLTFINYLSPLVNTQTIFNCLQILANFIFAATLVIFFDYFLRLFVH